MTGRDGLAACTKGAGCFYYEGATEPPAGKPVRHICSCNSPCGFDGYHSHDLTIENLKKCPLGKW